MTKFYKKNYPRLQFVRESYLDLDGEWNFRFDDGGEGPDRGWYHGFEDQRIRVPFSYEAGMSGIGCGEIHQVVWYSRKVNFQFGEQGGTGKRTLLNFEGSDYKTQLWVNGIYIGSHEGAYTRFTFDITEALGQAEAVVVLRIEDSLSTAQPRGKQRWLRENFDCWYVQTTGIWKSIWAEQVEAVHLDHLHLIPRYDDSALDVEYIISGEGYTKGAVVEVETLITFGEDMICSQRDLVVKHSCSKRFSLIQDNIKWKVKYWCPKSPHLYDVCVRIYVDGILADQVGSYFGLRKISTDSSRVKLNNMDCYLRMVLDQGYWKGSLLTPPDEEAIKKDIEKILEYGYNGVRKHQKTEDDRFYYWADVKGLLVWCEAPSYYELNETAMEHAAVEWADIVKQHYNHPSIITWVPFNESWGIPRIIEDKKAQNFTLAVYYMTKALDDTRPVVSNDGWEHTKSDIITLHDYAVDGAGLLKNWNRLEENLKNKRAFNGERYAFAKGFCYEGQPVMLSEFGGISYGEKNDGWGYGSTETSEEDFLKRLESLMDAVYSLDDVCGFCYTQLTDVQQEQNGHMYMDRRDKINSGKICRMIKGEKEVKGVKGAKEVRR